MEKKNYLELLKDPRWAETSKRIKVRDGWQCQYCGAKGCRLNVHHRYYDKESNPWECTDDVLVTLCEKCHNTAHFFSDNSYKQYKELKDEFAKHGFSNSILPSILSRINSCLFFMDEEEDEHYWDNSLDNILLLIKEASLNTENPNDLKIISELNDFHPILNK